MSRCASTTAARSSCGARCCCAPTAIRGPEDDAGTPAFDADGWLATGDLGRWLVDGRLHVAGRAGDLIVTGGENVWPEPVEAVLRDRRGVLDVAVTGTPDEEWGHVVTAVVVPSSDGPPSLDDLRAAVKETLPAFCAPRRLVLVEAIPRTALGKVRRPDLRRLASR